ncbi:MAG: hypothetical protein EOO40_02675 [Deltaproteobacteria bacterium]|nr:MAG: hypothetical protein EOO40_02675 [Deltaproteobacteria bacterium]
MQALTYYSLLGFAGACGASLVHACGRYVRAVRLGRRIARADAEPTPLEPSSCRGLAEVVAQDVVLLDARPWVRRAWSHDAAQCGKHCHTFCSADAMREALPSIATSDPPIFIGKTYDAEEDSHALAQSLYVRGYHQLTMLV